MDEVGQGLGHIELNTVEQVTAAERVGDDRELVVLAIAQKMRALAARTLGAVLVAGAWLMSRQCSVTMSSWRDDGKA